MLCKVCRGAECYLTLLSFVYIRRQRVWTRTFYGPNGASCHVLTRRVERVRPECVFMGQSIAQAHLFAFVRVCIGNKCQWIGDKSVGVYSSDSNRSLSLVRLAR